MQKEIIHLKLASNSNMNFQKFIKKLIAPSKLESKYTDILTDKLSLSCYKKAFTHSSCDPIHNYEVYEQLGDITVNKFLVWYFHNRFSNNLNSPFGVKIVARLRIKYGSKQFLSELADKMGFWEHIQYADELTYGKKMALLEDVFEAFIGVTEDIIDQRIYPGLGYISCYRILESIFSEIPIDLSYESLFDAKTRLKELFDLYKDQLGVVLYEYKKLNNSVSMIQVYNKIGSNKYFICSATSPINKSVAEQMASEQALQILAQRGYIKEISQEYKILVSNVIQNIPKV